MTESTELTQQDTKRHKKNYNFSKTWHSVLLGLIFLLGSSVFGLYFYTNNLINLQNNKIEESIATLYAKQEKISLSSLNQIKKFSQELDDKYSHLDKKISKTIQETAYLSDDWVMEKAKYFLELAVINNNWTDDANTTKKLLKAADDTLKNLQKDEITEIRKIIAYENLKISSIKKVDKIKLLAEINAINNYLITLPIISLTKRISNEETTKDPELKQANNWQANLKNNLRKLNQLIIIHRNTEDSTQFLSPSYLLTIRETLRLNLQQMQWAILEKNQEVFNLSCKQAIANLNFALEEKNPEKEALIKKLNRLQKINLHLTKIKIGKSLSELNKVIESTEDTIIKEEQHAD